MGLVDLVDALWGVASRPQTHLQFAQPAEKCTRGLVLAQGATMLSRQRLVTATLVLTATTTFGGASSQLDTRSLLDLLLSETFSQIRKQLKREAPGGKCSLLGLTPKLIVTYAV